MKTPLSAKSIANRNLFLIALSFFIFFASFVPKHDVHKRPLGLGMFKPYLFNQPELYLYNNPLFYKSVDDHTPIDTIKIQRLEVGGISIHSAPPYLVPEIMKLDYDFLAFRAVSITDDFIEIIVNDKTLQTMFVSRDQGKLHFWPEFLLSVNSIDLLENQEIKVKPLGHASSVQFEYDILRPIRIKNNWVEVELLDDNLASIGTGWVKWRDDERLFVKWSLFS